MKNRIKLFASDIDGTLTDGTIYYSEFGEAMKQFSHRDGRGFYLLNSRYKTPIALITSEKGGINKARYNKFYNLGTVEYFYDGSTNRLKYEIILSLCMRLGITIKEVAYIGDDTNDLNLLEMVGFAACPNDANYLIKKIKGIKIMKNKGGQGAVREFIDYLIRKNLVWKN